MNAEDQKLCDICHERLPTCHICYGGTGETKDLCETCYEASASPEELASSRHIQDAIRNGKCRYCGQPSAGGCGGFLPILGERLSLWCEQCRQDLAEFAQRPENAFPEGFPFDDAAAQERIFQQGQERERRQEEFMKQKVLQRRSKGEG